MSRAFDVFGNIVGIEDVSRGKNCNCTCLGCNSSLIARKGEDRAAHFSHDPNSKFKSDCSWAPETEVHIIAKEIIAEDKCLLVPIGTIEPKTELIKFDKVTLEVRQGNRIPDVVAELDGEVFYIEVAVTHSCDSSKVRDYKLSNKNCLEIDMSGYNVTGEFVSKNELREMINSAESSWISVAPTGNYASKINNHNRHQISELHKRYKTEKTKFQSQLATLQSNIQVLKNSESSAQAKNAYTNKQLKQINHKVKQAKSVLADFESNIEQHNSALQKVYMFEENQRQHVIWHEAVIASNNKRESELDAKDFRLSSLQLRLEDNGKALEQRQFKLEQYERSLSNKESRLERTIEDRALELAEAKLALLLKDKQSEIDEYDNRIKDAEKRFAEVKRKYGSYIKV
ncbi:hypothetical protein ACXIT2_22275 [Vibrio parahaemolyticus]|nr:hypothetical protein [Vibrio parahaemolyticus]